MRMLLIIFAVSGLTVFAFGQGTPQLPEAPVHVQRLTIVSTDLPPADREQIVGSFTGGSYVPDELAERIRRKLQDLGYYEARVEGPHVSIVRQSGDLSESEVSVQVQSGNRYYLDAIAFEGASAFPTDVLRRQFPIESGAVFTATAIAVGLDRVKNLYVEAGYPDFGAIPMPTLDTKDHRLSLAIQIDEGKQYRFGRLALSGLEPFAGAGHALLSCWSLQNKQYNPQLLKSWLATCTSGWSADQARRIRTVNRDDGDSAVVNVELQLQ